MTIRGSHLLLKATEAATYNMILQLIMRLMTFGLNAFSLRFISKEMLGVVNVRLILLYSTCLFIATEALDRVGMSKLENKNWPQAINLIWLSLPLSLVCSLVLGYAWVYIFQRPDQAITPNYVYGVIGFALATVIYCSCRQLFVIANTQMFIKLRVIINGISELFRCVINIILVIYFPHWGVINFALSQVLSAILYVICYYGYIIYYMRGLDESSDFPVKKIRDLFPRRLEGMPFIDTSQAKLAFSIFKQCVLKQFLTEGEKYVMTIFAVLNFAEQGIYEMVNHLGSLAVRFIFLPIEESGGLFFSQLLVRGEHVSKQKEENVKLATGVIRYLLKFVTMIGLITMVFGYSYSYLTLHLYGGKVLSVGLGPSLLRWYCVYVLIISINGITECFCFATMGRPEVDSYNRKLVIFSAILLSSSLILTNWLGSVGFIFANCINMICRIIHSIYYIVHYFQGSGYKPFQGVWPSKTFVASLVVAFIITALSENYFCCHFGYHWRVVHICIGVVCGLGVLLTVYLTEMEMWEFVVKQYKASQQKKSD
ncbi:hypothetical protein CHS0354_029904 [Potamilus streckersoni]|uniref:Protein RFT1 homolog n=1 Tax=Potamilus streckersoni TaxID=2493646 RepID=A0AAE0VJE9_9BIVA|nr:hypothetical protein CHS0354_029904 [Potamilus streckersoni]